MAGPMIPPPPDYSQAGPPPDAGQGVPDPTKGPVPVGVDTPSKFFRILGIAEEQRRVGGAGDNRLGPIPLPVVSPETQIALAAPGAATLLGRLGVQAGAQGVGSLARGEGLGEAAKNAAVGAGGQLVGEGISGVARLGFNAAAHKLAQSKVGQQNAFNKAFTDTLNTVEKQVFEKQAQAHKDKATKAIMTDLKAKVPALKDFPDDIKGLLDTFYGKGPELVSKDFDAAMKAAAEKAKGTLIPLPIDAANALNLKGTGGGFQIPPQIAARIQGPLKDQLSAEAGVVKVDAAEAIEAMIGKSRKFPTAYRAVANALDDAGLGDAEARQAYKSFMGPYELIDKVKGLKGEQLNPDKILGGFTERKTINTMRNRGEGDIFRGPLQAVRGAPTPPTPRQAPPEVGMPEGFKTVQNPLAGHPWISGMAGGAAGHALAGWPGHIAGFGLGAAGSNALPKQVVTRAPLAPQVERRLVNFPSLLQALGLQLAST